ncbi:MAG: DUF6152 family protein [Steroidobacteraceae bacterium]
MNFRINTALLLAAALSVAPLQSLQAHHAFAAEFDLTQPVDLTGTVTSMKWVNPHSWLYIDVVDAGGKVTNWGFEFGTPFSLQQKGLKRADLAVGAKVHVKGFRSKSGRPSGNASSVTLEDGRSIFTGAPDNPDAQRAGSTAAAPAQQ